MVSLAAVRKRAQALGRTDNVTPMSAEPEASAVAETTTSRPDGAGERRGTEAALRDDVDSEPDPEPEGGRDVMIVPIDAWNKMLRQLGNLHEAGQQLAEARERAAKAETEVTFLRERLTDLRETSTVASTGARRDLGPEAAPDTAAEGPPQANDAADRPRAGPDDSADPRPTTSFWRYVARGWRRRRR